MRTYLLSSYRSHTNPRRPSLFRFTAPTPEVAAEVAADHCAQNDRIPLMLYDAEKQAQISMEDYFFTPFTPISNRENLL